ncbi:MAG: GGDEF domain-containing protein [Trichocoleus desertorum ATA4-8-CV12]|nr:GGDEF domain-containing protein [Trichocoleus desertorum ATA4-8-CV12]
MIYPSHKYQSIQSEFFSQLIEQGIPQIGIVLIDVDQLILFNDKYGHHKGDEALEEIVHIIAHEVPPSCEANRVGGEEFLILLPELDLTEVVSVAEAIRKRVETSFLDLPKRSRLCSFDFSVCTRIETSLTITCAIAFYPQHGKMLSEILEVADKAMYEGAKQLGGNKTALAGNVEI